METAIGVQGGIMKSPSVRTAGQATTTRLDCSFFLSLQGHMLNVGKVGVMIDDIIPAWPDRYIMQISVAVYRYIHTRPYIPTAILE